MLASASSSARMHGCHPLGCHPSRLAVGSFTNSSSHTVRRFGASHTSRPQRSKHERTFRWICLASDTENAPPTATSSSHDAPSDSGASDPPRIKKTMAGLDALLGIVEDDASKAKSSSASSSQSSQSTNVSISQTALDKMAEAEAQRLSRGDASKTGAIKSDIDGQFQKIIDKARKLADDQKGSPASSSMQEQAALKREFESLLETITKPAAVMDKDDLKRLKDACFGPLTFWITETRPIQKAERTGMLIRGNLRDDRAKVFALVQSKVQELFQDKYKVFMVEDTEEEEGGMGGGMSSSTPGPVGTARGLRDDGPAIAFQIIPSAQAEPPQTDNLQRAAAAILGVLLVVSCLQLALASNINQLPKETLDWFANPANLNSDQLPPGLENWDPTTYFNTSLPILAAVLGVNISHEAGHRIMALIKGVKLGPSFFIPFSEVGSFGAITPFTSLLKDRQTMWDVSMAGPLAGAAVAATLLLVGLAQSSGMDPADTATAASFVAVPTPLFQGSLLLGGFTRLVLGEQALRGATVLVSPYVVAGWVGLITSALNLLPVGSVDGGRLIQAAFGRQTLALTSFFTYLGLGLGLLGSSLALPFGLYVIITQRTAEKYIQDSVTVPSSSRVAATAAAVFAAILILLPMAPELADSLGVGPASPFL